MIKKDKKTKGIRFSNKQADQNKIFHKKLTFSVK